MDGPLIIDDHSVVSSSYVPLPLSPPLFFSSSYDSSNQDDEDFAIPFR
jgi:hypothetical protein